jgi:hypothetical protein
VLARQKPGRRRSFLSRVVEDSREVPILGGSGLKKATVQYNPRKSMPVLLDDQSPCNSFHRRTDDRQEGARFRFQQLPALRAQSSAMSLHERILPYSEACIVCHPARDRHMGSLQLLQTEWCKMVQPSCPEVCKIN